jgi:hypothetical protein
MSSLSASKATLLPPDKAAASIAKGRKVSVFVRVRPLTESEVGEGCGILEGLALESKDGKENDAFGNINGFDAILGQRATNQEVFDRCFSDKIDVCLRGGTASMFCYGYTGGGKTHTTIGYGAEKGLFFLGAEKLLRELGKMETNANRDDKLFLRATACEMYLGEVYDLLGEEKLPCKLRVDRSGQLVVGAMITEQVDYSAGSNAKFSKLSCDHATKITRTGLRSVAVLIPEDLEQLNDSCVSQRASGTSTTHDQSSRSHAILRLEVVTEKSLALRNGIDTITTELPALQNAIDNLDNQRRFINIDMSVGTGGYGKVLRAKGVVNPKQGANVVIPLDCPGDLWIKYSTPDNAYALHDVADGDTPRTLAEWSTRLGIENLEVKYAMKSLNLPQDEVDAKLKTIDKELVRLRAMKAKKEKALDQFTKDLNDLDENSPKVLGGSVLLIDLAGADYDHRHGKAQKETAAINKSLLALKECFRSLASSSTKRPVFRNSKLTRILEDSLAPLAKSTQRKNLESCCVMLINVSPNAKLEHGTRNALRYGQMYSSTAGKKNGRRNFSKGFKSDRRKGGPKPWQKKRITRTTDGSSTVIEVMDAGTKGKK